LRDGATVVSVVLWSVVCPVTEDGVNIK
jgi:hypothetical protein